VTRQEFAAVAAFLTAGCGKVLTDDAMRVYLGLLHDLPVEAVQIAAQLALLESEYPVFPPVGKLRKGADEAMDWAAWALPPEQAWLIIEQALAAHGEEGYYTLPEHIRHVIAFSWSELCSDSSDKNREKRRARFMSSYEVRQEFHRPRRREPNRVPEFVCHAVASLANKINATLLKHKPVEVAEKCLEQVGVSGNGETPANKGQER
jgi:hypothetical protein